MGDPFEVKDCAPQTFLDQFINTTLPDELEEHQEIMIRNIKSLSNTYLGLVMMGARAQDILRKMAEFVPAFTKGCVKCCPVHCIQNEIRRIRPGRFSLSRRNPEWERVMARYHLD